MQYGAKNIKPREYYSVQAVSMFTTNQFILLCPKDIIRFYRESWSKVNLSLIHKAHAAGNNSVSAIRENGRSKTVI